MRNILTYIFIIICGVVAAQDLSEGELLIENRKVFFSPGESFLYDVVCSNVKIGSALFTFHGNTLRDGIEVYHITFDTRLVFFRDQEEIYAHKDTFFPLEIIRSIHKVGMFPTEIVELYDQKNFKVEIIKQSKFFKNRLVIQKDAPINNAILVPYFFRNKFFEKNVQHFNVSLPTADFNVKFLGKEYITTGIGEARAFVYESVPPQFKFWLSADSKRLPLKISMLNALNYSLVLNQVNDSGIEEGQTNNFLIHCAHKHKR